MEDLVNLHKVFNSNLSIANVKKNDNEIFKNKIMIK